jgi:hypothetical protein
LLRTNIINARLQRRIDLHQVHSNQASSLMNTLCNEVALP